MRSHDDALQFGLYLLGGGGLVVAYCLKRWKRRRRAMDVATSTISSAAQGLVELQGYAWPSQKLSSIYDKDCVFRKVEIQQYVRSKNSSRWQTISKYSSNTPFFLVDSTGVVKVEPADFTYDIKEQTLAWEDMTPKSKQFLIDNVDKGFFSSMPPLELGFLSGSYRCQEQAIMMGSPIMVHGNLWAGASIKKVKFSLSFKEFFKRISGDDQSLMQIKDINKDSHVSDSEAIDGMYFLAERAHIDASTAQQDGVINLDEQAFEMVLSGIVKKHDMYPSFIADCHQEHLIKRIGIWNTLGLWAGAAAMIAGLYMLLNLPNSF